MSLETAFIALRFVHFAAAMAMFGISIFVALMPPPSLAHDLARSNRGGLYAACAFGLATAFAMIAVQAGQMGNGWQDVLAPSVWQAVAGTAFGKVWQWHIGWGVAATLCAVLVAGRWQYPLLLILTGGFLASLGFVGHAAMQDGVAGLVHRANHAVHLLSAATWVGSLLPLLACLRYIRDLRHRAAATVALRRFSAAGHVAVVVVVLTGMVNTGMTLHAWPVHWASTYQLLLAIKIAVVALMIAQAVVNRYVIVPAMRERPDAALRALVRGTWLEIGMGVIVLLLVSGFATLEPV
jgi:putative copper resistance protein D